MKFNYDRLIRELFEPRMLEKLSIAFALVLLLFVVMTGCWFHMRVWQMSGYRRESFDEQQKAEIQAKLEQLKRKEKEERKYMRKRRKHNFLTRFRRSKTLKKDKK